MAERDEDRREERNAKLKKAGMAVGIGSAAIAAAMLYANRRKTGAKAKKKDD